VDIIICVAKFQILEAALMKIQVFCNVTLFPLVRSYWRCEGCYCL